MQPPSRALLGEPLCAWGTSPMHWPREAPRKGEQESRPPPAPMCPLPPSCFLTDKSFKPRLGSLRGQTQLFLSVPLRTTQPRQGGGICPEARSLGALAFLRIQAAAPPGPAGKHTVTGSARAPCDPLRLSQTGLLGTPVLRQKSRETGNAPNQTLKHITRQHFKG